MQPVICTDCNTQYEISENSDEWKNHKCPNCGSQNRDITLDLPSYTLAALPQDALTALIADPTEAMDVEISGWMDFSQTADRGSIAKELIALANHGGGKLIFGFREVNKEFVPDTNRPENLKEYSADKINGIVHKYADPPFHCKARNIKSPKDGAEYPLVEVPGGHRVPVRVKSAEGGKITHNAYYIRRPGPNSEPPQTSNEWNDLMQRCVVNAREEMLDRIRIVLAGAPTIEPAESETDRFNRFFEASRAQWRQLVGELPHGAAARLPLGHRAMAYQIILGEFTPPDGRELLRMLERAYHPQGSQLFYVFRNNPALIPHIEDGDIQCWTGENSPDEPAAAEFWRATFQAEFFQIIGFLEDSRPDRIEPGKYFELTLPIRQLAHMFRHAVRMSNELEVPDARILFRAEWAGLSGRQISVFTDPMRLEPADPYVCKRQKPYSQTVEVRASEVEDALAEIVYGIAKPLFELFDFFPLPKSIVVEELAKMRGKA